MNNKKILKIFFVVLAITILLSSFSTIGIQTKNTKQINSYKKIGTEPYDGKLYVYVVEPVSRWNNYDGNPYHFGFLDFAINETLSIDYLETYNKQITWNAQQAGYNDIQEDNIMVIATVFNPTTYKKYASQPPKNPFNAHYVDAAAAAEPGEIGNNFKNETFTHTVFCEEGTATWCHNCPETAESLKTVYENYNYPFYFVAMISDKVPKALDRLIDDYNIFAYPTCFFDAGYNVVVGSNSADTYKNNILTCGKRYVHDLNLSISLEWIETGILDIEVQITNNEENLNSPPDSPLIAGPTRGKIGVELEYKIETTDPEGDNVYYFIDWGDNTNAEWSGPYNSGEQITLSHVWENKETYIIKAKAKDINNHESDYGTLVIKIPRFYMSLDNFQTVINLLKILLKI